MAKFGRKYRLEVQAGDGSIVSFENPFTLEFAILHRSLSSAGTCTFKLYNLSQETRNKIYKDRFLYKDASGKLVFRSLKLYAGYQEDVPLPLIFQGNIREAKSYREQGTTNYITEITGYDYGFAMSVAKSNISFGSSGSSVGISKQQVVEQLVKDMMSVVPDGSLTKGYVNVGNGVFPPPKGYSYIGKTWDELSKQTDNQCFIHKGTINVMADHEVFPGDLAQIDATTGLLAPPNRAENFLSAQILFEPRLTIGQQVNFKSASNSLFNGLNGQFGQYKIVGIEHVGIISDAVNGKCITTVYMFFPYSRALQLAQTLGASI